MMDIKYPDIRVTLVGEDGNAFAILGRVRIALKKAGIAQEQIDRFMSEATNGDYDHLLQVVMAWVDVK
jgi:hypothetical protein